MILRSWHGHPLPGREADYLAFLKEVVFPEIRAVPGNRSARALRAVGGDGTILVLTEWDDLASVQAFAGVDSTVAVVPKAAESMLAEYDPRVRHFELVLSQE